MTLMGIQSSKLEGKVWQPAVNVEGFNFIYCDLKHLNQKNIKTGTCLTVKFRICTTATPQQSDKFILTFDDHSLQHNNGLSQIPVNVNYEDGQIKIFPYFFFSFPGHTNNHSPRFTM
jgi:hypothetical protein